MEDRLLMELNVRNLLSELCCFLFFWFLIISLFFYSLVFLFFSLDLAKKCNGYKCHIVM